MNGRFYFPVPLGAADAGSAGGAGVANTTTPGLLSLTARLYNSDSTPAAEQTKVRFEVAVGAQNRAMTFGKGLEVSATSDGVVVTAEYQLGGTHAGAYHALASGPNLGGAFWPEGSGVAVLAGSVTYFATFYYATFTRFSDDFISHHTPVKKTRCIFF